jgi:repressor LexA
MLTKKQHQLLIFIKNKLDEQGISPSFEEMKSALGLQSKSGVHRLIKALEERGFIRRLPHRARALEIIKLPDTTAKPKQKELELDNNAKGNVVSGAFGPTTGVQPHRDLEVIEIPLHGSIAAGTPIEALQNNDSFISIPQSMIGRGAHYALEVSGDSMIDLGIYDGDTAIIKQLNTAENGDIIVALVNDEEATLKTLHKRGHQVALKPANSAYSTQILPANQVTIQGKLVGLLRKY